MTPLAIYIHIPYCSQRCPYCDFNTYAVKVIPEDRYVSALIKEFSFYAQQDTWRGRTVRSIFFGGGTPSLFSPTSIELLVSSICTQLPVDPLVEITIEANPGSVDLARLTAFRQAGINRISFGVQSFQTHILRVLGRQHSSSDAKSAIANARRAGFTNINLDLMFGVPEQTVEDLRADLAVVASFQPKHLSTYSLTIEKGTPYYDSHAKGQLILPNEETVLSMIDEIDRAAAAIELNRYEISNYALSGYEAKANLCYWNADDYLGLGAGAHSFGNNRRHSNLALPKEYIEKIDLVGSAEAWSEELSYSQQCFEFFFLGLRKIAGVSNTDFFRRYNKNITDSYGQVVTELTAEGLLFWNGEVLRLSDKGLLFADSVLAKFIDSKGPHKNKLNK